MREYLIGLLNHNPCSTAEIVRCARITNQGTEAEIIAGLESLQRAGLVTFKGGEWERVYPVAQVKVTRSQQELFA